MSSSSMAIPNNFSSDNQNNNETNDENQPLMQALQETMQTTNGASVNPLFMSASSSDSETSAFQMIQKSLSLLEPMNDLAASHNSKQPAASQFSNAANSASTLEKLETVGKFAAML
jgi:hypothetical protein